MSSRIRRYRFWMVGALASSLLMGGWWAMAAPKAEVPPQDPQLHQRLDQALANEDKMQEMLAAMQEQLRVIKLRASSTRSGS